LLKTLKKEMDMTLLFISHDLALVKRIADRVAVMQDGKLVEINDTNEIFHNPQSPYTKELIASMSKLSLNSHSPK
jgi:ABC-type oligopeptide transport system ATPase subunit